MVWLEPALAAASILAIDQWSKMLVASRSSSYTSDHRLLSVRYTLNRNGALGAVVGVPVLLGLWALALGAVALILHEMIGSSPFGVAGIGAAVGGATGNVIDRMRRGAVVDFIAIGPWPVFNVADAAIVSGLGLTMLSLL
jgi:signal peptidase II